MLSGAHTIGNKRKDTIIRSLNRYDFRGNGVNGMPATNHSTRTRLETDALLASCAGQYVFEHPLFYRGQSEDIAFSLPLKSKHVSDISLLKDEIEAALMSDNDVQLIGEPEAVPTARAVSAEQPREPAVAVRESLLPQRQEAEATGAPKSTRFHEAPATKRQKQEVPVACWLPVWPQPQSQPQPQPQPPPPPLLQLPQPQPQPLSANAS